MTDFHPVNPKRLAREMVSSAAAWAKTLLICVGREDTELEPLLAEEILAFGLYLLEQRKDPSETSRHFVAEVRAECRRLREERGWRSSSRHRRLPCRSSPAAPSETNRESLIRIPWWEGRYGVTERSFDEFCRATGLSRQSWVGEGENLAALVFYVILHGMASSEAGLSAQQTASLLRAMRECRVQLAGVVGPQEVVPAERRIGR